MKDNVNNEFNKAIEEAKAKFSDNPDMREKKMKYGLQESFLPHSI
ncbi:unnamed protein product [marine sediment metagenome]|uniref:Uncharacterized protein n=1 Tax=marine sediment metagenome TaxID=412755 RepID=X1C503_9ZZZZ